MKTKYLPGIETLNPFGEYTSTVASGTSYCIELTKKLLNSKNQNISHRFVNIALFGLLLDRITEALFLHKPVRSYWHSANKNEKTKINK